LVESEKKATRAAIYARVSMTGQDPELQLRELREYVKQRGFVLHKEYVDRVTGDFAKRKKKRKQPDPAYQELMADVNKRLVDCVIVWKFDRFARSLTVLVNALDHFKKLGVEFISYTQSIDTTTALGRFFYNVIGSFAEFEKEMIVERVNAGLANARAKGVQLGRPEKDPSAARRIQTLREEGWSFRKIADREKLSPAGVLKILRRTKNEDYTKVAEAEKPQPPTPVITEPNTIPQICQLKIYLTIIKPKIWRRVLVPSNITLSALSDVIQKLFGWTDFYPHMFVPRTEKGDGYELKCDENSFRLCDVDIKPGGGMLYEYGCLDWTHEVTFEKFARFDDNQQLPVCIAGKMDAPPDEYCDGAMDYLEKRKSKRRSKSSVIKTFINGLPYIPNDSADWYSSFDPNRFDLDEINQRLGVASPEKNELIEAKRSKSETTVEIYQFKITILGVSPQIWRRVQLKSESTLADFADVIVAAFDWSGQHLHKFLLSNSWGDELEESKKLSALGLRPDNSFIYIDDFGDYWEHEIIFEKAVRFDKSRSYPICTAGQNAGPPEDCGGPEAYMNARNFLSRRKGKKARAPRGRVSASEKDFYTENYRSFDPDKFDRNEVNRKLVELFKPKIRRYRVDE